jgi:peptidoglycan/xylan/chitin deacetylase (PgdA/CDA1 family)/SAM-dependent methyltransferase
MANLGSANREQVTSLGAPDQSAQTELSSRHHWEGVFAEPDPWHYGSDYEDKKLEQTLSLLPAGPIGNALELACAEGYFTLRLAPHVGHLVASDISPTALSRARLRCAEARHVEFAVLDMVKDDLPQGLDLVVCSEVLYYMSQARLPELAAKIAGSLKPGGHLLMTHAKLIGDDRTSTAFDFGHPFGARTIGQVFAGVPGLSLVKRIETPLYMIHLFRRKASEGEAAAAPEVLELPLEAALPPEVERHVCWGGATLTRAEAQDQELTSEVPILCYHSIAEDGPPEMARYRTSPAAFREQLRYLRREGFHSISLEEWAASIAERRMLPGRPVVITFDDGYRDFAGNAWPLLQRADFTATVFVVTNKVGGVADWDKITGEPLPLMGWDELRQLQAEGVTIASHMASHKDLLTLTDEEIIEDGKEARRALRDMLGMDVGSIAFPFGRNDARVNQAVARSGYSIAVGTFGGMSTLLHDPIDLPRVEIFAEDDIESFARKIERKRTRLKSLASGSDAGAAAIDRRPDNQARGPDMPLHPDYATSLASRLDVLIGEFISLQTQLLNSSAAPPLQKRLCALFQQPVTGRTSRELDSYAEIGPGIVVGFENTANVLLTVEPKRDHAVSPETHLNTVELAFRGTSRWFSIELVLDWADISSAKRYQISVFARPSRTVSCQMALRLPRKDGQTRDLNVAQFELASEGRNANKSGELQLPDFVELDTQKVPKLLVFFDSKEDLILKLNYMNIYFA